MNEWKDHPGLPILWFVTFLVLHMLVKVGWSTFVEGLEYFVNKELLWLLLFLCY